MRVLIVDDSRLDRRRVADVLSFVEGTTVVEAQNLEEARAALETGDVDVALIDIRLSSDLRNRDGLTLIKEIRERHRAEPVVISGSNDWLLTRSAMRLGAVDYIAKDEISDGDVQAILQGIQAKRGHDRASDIAKFRMTCSSRRPVKLIGRSPAMQKLRDLVQRVATSDRPVLVDGPTGSGKELVVAAIHSLGLHPDQAILSLNCAALPETLIESQLFGHEKGTFTGAVRRQPGFFSTVRTGTLFLDEIAELPLEMQAKLLRVLESRSFTPLGSTKSEEFQGRVVAATHADLLARVDAGAFREDLYYRLNVLAVHVPSLADRREDIPALVEHFASMQNRPLEFTEPALRMLQEADWPANVRQLRNLIDRLAVLAPDSWMTPGTIAALLDPVGSGRGRAAAAIATAVMRLPDEDKLQATEEIVIQHALRSTGGNKSAAAELLGVHRKVIERRTRRDSGGADASEER